MYEKKWGWYKQEKIRKTFRVNIILFITFEKNYSTANNNL